LWAGKFGGKRAGGGRTRKKRTFEEKKSSATFMKLLLPGGPFMHGGVGEGDLQGGGRRPAKTGGIFTAKFQKGERFQIGGKNREWLVKGREFEPKKKGSRPKRGRFTIVPTKE